MRYMSLERPFLTSSPPIELQFHVDKDAMMEPPSLKDPGMYGVTL